MSRDEAIALLVSDTVDSVLSGRHVFWLQRVLEDGFHGYSRWTDEELRQEVRARGLDVEEIEDCSGSESFDEDYLRGVAERAVSGY